MPARSKKPASSRALPADVTGIRLRFSFQIGWDETPSDGPSYWHVSADVHDLEDDRVTHHVGSLVFYRVEPTETRDLFGVMDGYDADLGHIAEMIIDTQTGDIDDDLRDNVAGFESDILVLCRAELEKDWRGFGLGAVLAARAIKQLGHGCIAVVLQPASILPETRSDDETKRRAAKRIAKAWEKIGFNSVSEDLMVLDLATTTLNKSLARQTALIRRLPTDE
jgi:GNAT superfamily N-acetyltransferase